ncbi:MAG: pilus assembly protein PilM [Planctomycetota bacterium]|jgi:type IV pilus assembly protein PilM
MNLDWKRPFRLEHHEVLGLDVGSSQVKAIQLHKDDTGYRVTAAGIVDFEPDGVDSGGKEANIVEAIRKCLHSAGAQTQLAVCGVSGPEVAVRDFKFPSLAPDEIEGAVLLEAAQVCPFNVNDGSVDYQLVPGGGDGVRGVLVAATNGLTEAKRRLAEDAALRCVLMDVDGLALLNCLDGLPLRDELKDDSPGEAEKRKAGRKIAILNVGNSYTTLAVVGHRGLPFVRDIAYAGSNIVEQMAADSGLSAERIRRILRGGETNGGSEPELNDTLAKACQKLIVEVTETLRYCMAQEKAEVVEQILVCGGFALVKGFVELLDSQLPARAVLWNPFLAARCKTGKTGQDVLAKKGPALAVAAGLAMRTI